MKLNFLKDKVIVITGGAGFIGRHFCKSIVEQGGLVVVSDIDLDAANLVVGEIAAEFPSMSIASKLDITCQESIDRLINSLHKKFGRIDAVVNNAYPRNKNYGRKVEDVTYADFCGNVGLHLGGYFLMMQRFGQYFSSQGGGNIINMSSIYGVVAPRFEVYEGTPMTMPVEYAAIKAAILHLTRYFAQYYKGGGIRVNALSPGGILDCQPESFINRYKAHCGVKGMLDPEDITGALLFLLSDASCHITGQNLLVDDGFTL